MTEWSKNYGANIARRLGFENGKTPSVGTLFTVFSRVDAKALEIVLNRWAEQILSERAKGSARNEERSVTEQASPPESAVTKKRLLAVSIDGKTVRGSRKQGAVDTHLLSVVSHDLGLTIFQEAVDDKTNEIGAVEAVLEALILQGRVVTVDAMLTQKDVAQKIVDKGGTM
jgi:hypothetical protein